MDVERRVTAGNGVLMRRRNVNASSFLSVFYRVLGSMLFYWLAKREYYRRNLARKIYESSNQEFVVREAK